MQKLLAMTLAASLAAGAAGAATPTVLHVSSHLSQNATASLDGHAAVTAPGEGSTNVRVTAGRHVLKVTTAAHATYEVPLDLKAATLMRWHGKGYWCVNLLDGSADIYSKSDCQEEVTDAG